MDRRYWLLVTLVLAGCRSQPEAPVFPPALAGWKLKSMQDFPLEGAPEVVRRIGTRGCWRAIYEGAGSVKVEMYALAAPAAGLEMTQQWRPVADTVVWYTPHYFVVVGWQNADHAAVSALIRGLQTHFGERQ